LRREPKRAQRPAAGAIVEETEESIREAIQFHIDGLPEDGPAFPPHQTASTTWKSWFRGAALAERD